MVFLFQPLNMYIPGAQPLGCIEVAASDTLLTVKAWLEDAAEYRTNLICNIRRSPIVDTYASPRVAADCWYVPNIEDDR